MGILYIVNPTAGRDRAKNLIPIIEDIMSQRDVDYKIVTTKGPEDGTKIAYQGIKEGYETVVAVGGDGTINEVTKGILLAGKGNLGIIPGGTGNDLARTLNIPSDPEETINIILKGKVKEIDVGEVADKNFLNVASTGLDSEIAKNTEKIKKYIKGKFAYTIGLLKTLFLYKNKRVKIQLDNLEREMDILLIAVANGKYYGGGMKISPDAAIDDGYFHVCLIKKISKLKLLFIFPSVFKGRHGKYKKYVEFHKSKKVRIETTDKIYLNIDGEVFDVKNKIVFNIDNSKINTLVR